MNHKYVKLHQWTEEFLQRNLLYSYTDWNGWRFHCAKCVQTRSFFWSVFSRIRTQYGEILRISPYSVQMRQNTDQKKLRIWTLFTQCFLMCDHLIFKSFLFQMGIFRRTRVPFFEWTILRSSHWRWFVKTSVLNIFARLISS